ASGRRGYVVGCWRLAVELAVGQHGVDDVAAASCKAHDGCVVLLSFGAFALVVGLRGAMAVAGDPGAAEHGVFEALVATTSRELALDGGATASGDRCDAGVGGQV